MRFKTLIPTLVLSIVPWTQPAIADEILYVFDEFRWADLLTIDKNTGQVLSSVAIQNNEALFGGLAVDKSGMLFSIDGFNDPEPDRLFRIDPRTGFGTAVGSIGENWDYRCVCVNPVTDEIYGTRDNALYTLDKTTGLATLVAPITGTGLANITAFAINSKGEAYGTDVGPVELFTIDLQSGQATFLGELGVAGTRFNDLAFDTQDVLYGTNTLNGGLATIDIATLNVENLFSGHFMGLAFYGDTPACYPDCDPSTGPGVLDIFDFLCFQDAFVGADPYACDCDTSTGLGVCDIFDFLCFQDAFVAGCP